MLIRAAPLPFHRTECWHKQRYHGVCRELQAVCVMLNVWGEKRDTDEAEEVNKTRSWDVKTSNKEWPGPQGFNKWL